MMVWRKLTDLTDEEVKDLLLDVLNIEKRNTNNIVRHEENQLITADVTTELEDGKINLYEADLRADFRINYDDRVRYLQWLLAHNVCWLAFDNPYIK